MNELIDHVNDPWIIKNLLVWMYLFIYSVTEFHMFHPLNILCKPAEAMRSFRKQGRAEENKDDPRASGI